jgi:ABC-type transporter Mla maintaining outer membrane lipid asymmetry ATPase subunit MlaF
MPALELSGVVKKFGGLRPLRIASLDVPAGQRVAINGIDAVGAELLINLITGATLPDEGRIVVLGKPTADIQNGEEWLAWLERFGIVSDRAVLLEGATVEQNLAMPFTLQIDAPPEDVQQRIAALAGQCGIEPGALKSVVGELPGSMRARVHLARALALEPAVLLLEHPTARFQAGEGGAFGEIVARVGDARQLTAVAITTDADFAKTMAHRALALRPADGALVDWKLKRGWFTS